MRNSAKAKFKFSKLDRLTNKMIALTLCVQISLALTGAAIGASWNKGAGADASYMGANSKTETHGFGYYLLKQTGTWILIFTNFVPISLMVTLELVKFWQAMFMASDATMYDEEQDMAMRG